MNVDRYIKLCDSIKDTPDGPALDKLIDELDALYLGMTEQDRQAVDAHYDAKDPG